MILIWRTSRQPAVCPKSILLFFIFRGQPFKYTPQGTVSIYLEDGSLCIRDTGIGIAPEDLPRIFERGYTGCNGRSDKKASGLGLYLCRRICNNLGHNLTAESTPGVGTLMKLDLNQTRGRFE